MNIVGNGNASLAHPCCPICQGQGHGDVLSACSLPQSKFSRLGLNQFERKKFGLRLVAQLGFRHAGRSSFSGLLMIMTDERVNYQCPATRRLLLADFRRLSSHLSIGNFKRRTDHGCSYVDVSEDLPLVGYPQGNPNGPLSSCSPACPLCYFTRNSS